MSGEHLCKGGNNYTRNHNCKNKQNKQKKEIRTVKTWYNLSFITTPHVC